MVPKPAISRTCLAALTHVAMLGPRAGDAYTQSIVLTAPLPIVVIYLTARVDDAGTVFFYRRRRGPAWR